MGKPSDLLMQEEDFNESAQETMDYAFENLKNYDENAKVQRIARDEDLPEEAVRENLDELTRTRKKYDFSDHPKSAEFFADPDNASVVGDDVEHYKSLEQTLKDRKEPIFGERTAKLAWNAMTEARASITRALGTIAEGQREKIIRRYLGDDTYERAKAIDEKAKKEGAYVDPIEELSKTENRYAYREGIDFSRKRTPETVKKAFSEEGVISGIGEAGGFMYDTGVESMAAQIPLMAIKTAGAPFYLLNLTEQIAQERAKNNGKEMTDEDMAWALPWAAASYALDVFGFKGMIGAGKADKKLLKEVAEGIAAKTVVKEGLKAGGREAGTEAFQEGFLEYMGERFGTKAKIELSEMLETGAWAGLAGGGMGVAIGTPSAYLNDRERRIKVLRDNERRRDINSVDGQLIIESVLDVVQQMPSVERSPEHVEKFMQAVGPDKQIIVTNEGLKAASVLGIQIPEGMRSPLGDAVLRISDFVNQVANKPDLLAAIRPHLKMRQDDMTQFEMDNQEGNPELAYLFGRADKASKMEKENRAAIEGVVKAMAGTRRMSEGTARKLTKFLSEYANRYVEDAAKKGVVITPKDAIDAMKLRFVGPKVDMDKEVNFEKAAARMLPREEFESFKKLPKSEQLDRVARHYAALPVEQGGLGLSATNTREERENALGVKFKSGEDYVPQVSKSKPLEQSALPDKITIDGVEKHTRNSNGDYIAADEQGIRNFYEWFGASKVVDADGRPLVVYHGGKEGIEEFDAGKAGSIQSSDWGRGIYFTPTEWVANSYKEDANKATNEAANAAWDAIEAKSKEYGTDPMYVSIHLNSKKITQEQYDEIKALEKEWRDALGEAKKVGGDVYAVYLRMEDPLYYTYDGITDHTLSMQAKAQGKDGLIVEPMTEYVAFNPTQIKSVANVGSFSRDTGNIYLQSAYHGTPHKFDKFSLDAIGTGEGAQAYGWGLYFASEKSVAEFYRDNVVDASRIGEINNRLSELVKEMDQYRGVGYGKFTDKKGYDLQAEYESLVKEKEDKGNLYQVEIPEDTELMHWDKPLSEQPESVRRALEDLFKGIDESYLDAVKKYDAGDKKALKNAGFNLFDYPGAAGGMYERLAFLNNPKKASKIMNGKGIKGIKYLDGSSRGKGEGSYNYVIFDDKVVTIEAVNDEMRQAEVFYQKSESGFFSQLQKAAEELKQEKGTPDQMLAMLKKAGVKDAEIEATGLKEFMELAGKSITKAQIVEFVSNNGVQVETTVLGSESEAKEEGFSVIDDDGRRMASFDTEEEADDYASENGGFVEPSARQKARESRARNTNYTLPGGENHVELVLSIPNIEGWNQGDTTHYGDIADGKAVAWVRANDRTDAEGKKVLFIEEIQSKRAQEGRSRGFAGKKVKGYQVTFGGKSIMTYETKEEAEAHVARARKYNDEADIEIREVIVKRNDVQKGMVPSAPFVEKTDAWVSLAMKRMITYAVENGYDRVAWTTGEQQADRYSLSKTVDVINIQSRVNRETGEVNKVVHINVITGSNVSVSIDDDGVITESLKNASNLVGKNLAEVIGKDITKEIVSLDVSRGEKSISGEGLNIGGEGMKSFYDKIIPSIVKEVTKKMDGRVVVVPIVGAHNPDIRIGTFSDGSAVVEGAGDDKEFDTIEEAEAYRNKLMGAKEQPGFDITDKMREQVQGPGLPLFQNKPDPLGATYQMPLGDRVIKLFEKSNPSTMLHEMSHLFLLMEQDFAEKYGMTETHKDLLKWLGVDSFDQITKDHHEQFAGSFEAYIMEGKSPSIALSDVFAAAKHWMLQVYEFIRNIPNQKIDPEISSIFDRLLATEQQLEEVKGSPMYNQFFADKDEAGWSNKDWIDYIGLQARRENKAKETIDQKLMKEWKRMRTKEWLEERDSIKVTEEVVLKASPVYRAMAAMREFKLNRDQALEAMGLEIPLSAEDRARKAAMPKPTDSLLVFAAKRGGLNIEAYKKAGLDPADMKKTQSGVFGKPVFTKDGMTPAQFAEAATEAGYMESRGYTIDAETYDDLVDDNDVLDLVTRSVIQGEEFFTVEGDAIRQEEADKQRYLDQYFEEHGQYPPEEVVEETPEEKLAKSLKKYLSTDGMPVEMTATEHGYGSAKEMIEAVLAAPKIKEQAKINADEAMIAKYGTLLDDATLEAEVRDAVQNEEQAKLLLMEIKALGKVAKKKEINRDYLKMKATRLVDEMTRKDMRTGDVYRRMIKAAEAAKKANAEAAKIRAAIAKEKEAAAGELAAEVGERAVEAQNQLEEAEKDYKKKKEIMQDVYEDLKLAKGYAEKAKKERAEKDAELKAVEKSKKALDAKKKKGSEVDEEEYQSLVERLKESKKAANEAAKAELSRNAAVVRLEKDYDVSRSEATGARKLADTLKERAEKQVTRATEKEGKVEEAKSETAKKLAELEAELVAVAEKALEFKIQHLANHYLYQEITERKAAMDRQLTYLRRVDGKDYDPKVVDPDYIAQAKKLIRLYNTVTKSKKDERKLTEELSELLSWYDTQVKAAETLDQDEGGTGNRQPLLWLSEELIAALAAKMEGNLAEFKLKQISNMTSAEVQGLYDTIKHIRYIGGKSSEDAKAEYQKSQEEIADNIKENAGKTIKRKHEKNVFDRTKESLGAYWHSMESSFLMFSILDGFSNGPIMKHWESFIDAVNRHIELERDFAKTIDGIMRPILVKIASPIKVTITKEDGVSWSLSKQARFVLLLNMGNQSNIDTVLQGMNANFDDSYTYNDLMQMVSGMSKAELEAANKIWAYKDQTLWPLISAIQRKVSGVSAAKIEPVPFVVNGVKMIGGHYRLHYKADQKDQGRDFELESVGKMKMLMGKQASQIERVGSGGREVDLEHLHLYTDISQELRFIAFKEFSISISKFLNGANNPVRAAIIQHHGAEFLKYFEDTINGVVNRPVNSMDMFSRGSRAIRSNMVYSYLSFSLRSIVQAATSVAPMMSQLGEARTLMAFMEFWSNPYGNFKKVDSMSMAMKERLKFINHEATTELSKLSAWSPVVNLLKKGAFMPHAVIDAFFAYPAWMGAKRKYLDENPVDSNTDFKRREKLANDFADLTMKQIMGSGHKADVGGVFSSPDEMVKSILFMGTFSNSMFNTNAYNIEKFKAGKMPWYELARRQGWMMIGAPLIWLAVLDEFPDPEDENYWLKMAGQIVGYNFSMLVAANHVYNYAVNDFEFTLPLMKAVESSVGLAKSGKELVVGDAEFDLKMQAKIVRDLGPLVPMFGGSEMSRIMKGIEEERDWYSTYVTGKRD